MTAAETQQVVIAVVALLSALTGWLTYQAQRHEKQLNGPMGTRITAGANAAIAADAAAQAAQPATTPDAYKAARLKGLQAEMDALNGVRR